MIKIGQKKKIIIGISVLLSIFFVYLVDEGIKNTKLETTKIVVLSEDIEEETIIEKENLTIISVLSRNVNGSIIDINDLIGKQIITTKHKGEVIFDSDLYKDNNLPPFTFSLKYNEFLDEYKKDDEYLLVISGSDGLSLGEYNIVFVKTLIEDNDQFHLFKAESKKEAITIVSHKKNYNINLIKK